MAEKITLRNRDLKKLYAGLAALDGIKRGENDFLHFDFAPNVKWNIAKNLSIVEREIEIYNRLTRIEARKLEVADGVKITDMPKETAVALSNVINDILDLEVTLNGILKFTIEQLTTRPENKDPKMKDIKTNPIPPTVLKDLMPIIEEAE